MQQYKERPSFWTQGRPHKLPLLGDLPQQGHDGVGQGEGGVIETH